MKRREKISKSARTWVGSIDAARTDKMTIVSRDNSTFAYCVICTTELIGRRGDARTCSSECRSALRRERETVQRTLTALLHNIGDLQMVVEHPDPVRARAARHALADARRQIIQACKESGVP